jgi:hypothetical protein
VKVALKVRIDSIMSVCVSVCLYINGYNTIREQRHVFIHIHTHSHTYTYTHTRTQRQEPTGKKLVKALERIKRCVCVCVCVCVC